MKYLKKKVEVNVLYSECLSSRAERRHFCSFHLAQLLLREAFQIVQKLRWESREHTNLTARSHEIMMDVRMYKIIHEELHTKYVPR